jgi:hypothetical protein
MNIAWIIVLAIGILVTIMGLLDWRWGKADWRQRVLTGLVIVAGMTYLMLRG